MKPLVSVIITTFNRSELVKKAIDSVLNQTYMNFELIVVDDCSTDHTKEAVNSFSDDRITYIQHAMNKGEGSRNSGLECVRGDYVAFLDDDDEWFKDKLELQVDLLSAKPANIGVVHTGRVLYYTSTEEEVVDVKHRLDFCDNALEDLAIDNGICTSTVMVRRQCLDQVGYFDETFPYCQDYDMWIRLAEGYQFTYIHKPLIRYRYHQTNLSKNWGAQIKGREMLYEKHAKYFSQSTPYNSRHYFELGVLKCLNNDMKKARKMYMKSIWLHPSFLKSYIAFGVSLLGSRFSHKVFKTPK